MDNTEISHKMSQLKNHELGWATAVAGLIARLSY